MSNARWVQYKNDPQGKKFLVVEEGMVCWKIKFGTLLDHNCWAPKSEYTLCDPPEEWEDVTSEFHATRNWPSTEHSKSNGVAHTETQCMFWIPCEMHHSGNLRLRKIDCIHNGPAFIVEKRKT